jgi:hypothetical protein
MGLITIMTMIDKDCDYHNLFFIIMNSILVRILICDFDFDCDYDHDFDDVQYGNM